MAFITNYTYGYIIIFLPSLIEIISSMENGLRKITVHNNVTTKDDHTTKLLLQLKTGRLQLENSINKNYRDHKKSELKIILLEYTNGNTHKLPLHKMYNYKSQNLCFYQCRSDINITIMVFVRNQKFINGSILINQTKYSIYMQHLWLNKPLYFFKQNNKIHKPILTHMIYRKKRSDYKEQLMKNIILTEFHSHKELYLQLWLIIDEIMVKDGMDSMETIANSFFSYVAGYYNQLGINVVLVDVTQLNMTLDHSPNAASSLRKLYTHVENIVATRKIEFNSVMFLKYVRNLRHEKWLGAATHYSVCRMKNSINQGLGIIKSSGIFDIASKVTLVHELGHTLGFQHNSKECECADPGCVMDTSGSSTLALPLPWSPCAGKQVQRLFEKPVLSYCLRTKPKKIYFQREVCGNGILEQGEECDDGFRIEGSINPFGLCCDTYCKLIYGPSSCSSGRCCDLKDCKIRPKGYRCDHFREKVIPECDLPEYCSGTSQHCPKDTYKMNGTKCNKGKDICVNGRCMHSSAQCEYIFGPGAGRSPAAVSDMCQSLSCVNITHPLSSLSIVSQETKKEISAYYSFERLKKTDIKVYRIESNNFPIWDGTTCNIDKKDSICINNVCNKIPSTYLGDKCLTKCNGYGPCNQHKECHCIVGRGGPDCLSSGCGGSESGGRSCPQFLVYFWGILYLVIFIAIDVVAIFFILLGILFKVIDLQPEYVHARHMGPATSSGSIFVPPDITRGRLQSVFVATKRVHSIFYKPSTDEERKSSSE